MCPIGWSTAGVIKDCQELDKNKGDGVSAGKISCTEVLSADKCQECALGARTVSNYKSQSYCIDCVAGQYGLKVNEWKIKVKSQLVAILAINPGTGKAVKVSQGSSSGILSRNAKNTPIEWTLVVAQNLNVNVGDKITQQGTDATGTLKTALTDYIFTIDSPLLVAFSLLPGNVVSDSAGYTGTLKTAINGVTTTFVVEAAAANIAFKDGVGLTIGTKYVTAYYEVAGSKITQVVKKEETSLVIETAVGITFLNSANVVIKGTSEDVTVAAEKINTVSAITHTDDFEISIEADDGTTFNNNVDLLVGSTLIKQDTIISAEIKTHYNTCHYCKKGQYSKAVTDANGKITNCEPCPKGEYAKEDGATFCMPVLPGSYDKGDPVLSVLSTYCPRGWFQDLPQEDNCRECPRGRYQDVVGGSICKLW